MHPLATGLLLVAAGFAAWSLWGVLLWATGRRAQASEAGRLAALSSVGAWIVEIATVRSVSTVNFGSDGTDALAIFNASIWSSAVLWLAAGIGRVVWLSNRKHGKAKRIPPG